MHRGWVKLWRRAMDSPVFKSPELWHLFSYCLMMADHEPYRAIFGGKQVDFPSGTFITGRFVLAERLGLSPSTVRNRLVKCRDYGLVDTKSDNKRTVVTICNWERYQANGFPEWTGERTTKGQQKDNQRTLPKEPKTPITEEAPSGEKPAASRPHRKLSESPNEAQRFMGFFDEEFERRTGEKAPPRNFGKDTKIAKELLAVYGFERCCELARAMWDSTDDFIVKAGKTLGTFKVVLPKLLQPSRVVEEPDGRVMVRDIMRRNLEEAKRERGLL